MAGTHRVAFLQAFQKDRVCDQLQRMRNEGLLCDINIVCGDVIFRAHKAVLAASNSYFSRLMAKDPDYDVYTFTTVTPQAMQILLDFLYCGKLAVASTDVMHVLSAADLIEVDEVRDYCRAVLIHRLDFRNVTSVWELAEELEDELLLDSVIDFCRKSLDTILEKEFFVNLPRSRLVALLEGRKGGLRPSDDVLLRAALAWVGQADKERAGTLSELLAAVHLDSITDACVVSLEKQGLVSKLPDVSRRLTDMVRRRSGPPTPVPQSRRSLQLGICLAVEEEYGLTSLNVCWCGSPKDEEHKVAVHCSNVALASSEELVYVVGGEKDGLYMSSAFEFNIATGDLQRLPDMLTNRVHACAAVFMKRLFVGGGFNENGYLQSVECLDLDTYQWTVVAPFTEAKFGSQMALFHGRLLVVGGWNGFCHVTTVECYDPVVDQWTLMAPLTYGRSFAGVVELAAGKLVVTGGLLNGRDAAAASSVQYFHPLDKLWETAKVKVPVRAWATGACVHDGCIHLVTEEGHVIAFDPVSGQSQTKQRYPVDGTCKVIVEIHLPKDKLMH